ncbi:hypothetical protein PTKIN_Ptkin07bG0256200 [Pterospermum kingtungense]
MSCLSWNCCGLENPQTVRALWKILSKEDPKFLFLSETILQTEKLERVRMKCEFQNCFGVDPEGRSGGLTMMWKDEINLQIKSYSKHHIDAEVTEHSGLRWRLTGIYGEPDTNLRSQTWSLLWTLARDNSLPWLCLGDFNELMWLSEKEGGRLIPEWQMRAFRDALEDAKLEDLGYVRHFFTWKRGKHKETLVKERLDRATATND